MCARERGWWKRDQEMEDFKHLILQPHFLFHWLSFLIKVIHPLDLKRQTALQDLLWKTAMPPSPCPFPPPIYFLLKQRFFSEFPIFISLHWYFLFYNFRHCSSTTEHKLPAFLTYSQTLNFCRHALKRFITMFGLIFKVDHSFT